MKYYSKYNSPIGELIMVSSGEKLNVLKPKSHRYFEKFCDGEQENNNLEIFIKTKKWLDRYFKGENPKISELEIEVEGTEFRKEVWKILCEVPYGEVTTYGDIAKKIANKKGIKTMSGQAVGGSVGHNPISIIIPCHRVVGTNKSLTGYGGGIQNKVKLLKLEGIDINKYTIPKKGTAL